MGVLTELVKKHDLEGYVRYKDSEIVEGIDTIMSPASNDFLSSVTIAHFLSSGLKNKDISIFNPTKGSIHEKLLSLYG
jgi:hypothetical protein